MSRRNKYRADKREEELEDDLPDEDAETEDEDIDAEEDDDDDISAEDDDPEAEDEDPDVEDDEGSKSRHAKAFRMKERRRCAGLTRLSKTARKLGIHFNATAAIANGTSLAKAKSRILAAASARDNQMNVSPYAPNAERSFGKASHSQVKTMWRKAKGKKQ